MIAIKNCYSEYIPSKYTASYDSDHDILRVFTKQAADYSYETFSDFIELAVEENTNVVIGVEVSEFLNNASSVDDMFAKKFPFMYKVLLRAKSSLQVG